MTEGIYHLDNGWKVMPVLCKYEGGVEEYHYNFCGEQGACLLTLTEHDMMVITKMYSQHNGRADFWKRMIEGDVRQ